MGFLRPTVKPGVVTPQSDLERMAVRARLQKSTGASLLKAAGILFIVVGVVTITLNPLGLIGGFGAALTGGLVWAAGAIVQAAWDLRTIALRQFDLAEDARIEGANHA